VNRPYRATSSILLSLIHGWLNPGIFLLPALAIGSSVRSPAPVTGARLAKLPLYFEVNRGQTDRAVHFVARGQDHGIYLGTNGATLVFAHEEEESAQLGSTSLDR